MAEYGWKPHRMCVALKKHITGLDVICMTNRGYGFIEFEMSNSTISSVFRQPRKGAGRERINARMYSQLKRLLAADADPTLQPFPAQIPSVLRARFLHPRARTPASAHRSTVLPYRRAQTGQTYYLSRFDKSCYKLWKSHPFCRKPPFVLTRCLHAEVPFRQAVRTTSRNWVMKV